MKCPEGYSIQARTEASEIVCTSPATHPTLQPLPAQRFSAGRVYRALEQTHYLVFGYGNLIWEWTQSPRFEPFYILHWTSQSIGYSIFLLDGTSLLVRDLLFRLPQSIYSWGNNSCAERSHGCW